MVRSVAAALNDFDASYETASRTLGAVQFTALRTITLPLIKGGILTGIILAIARSLSETGATSIALTLSTTASKVNTAPTLIAAWRALSVEEPSYLYAGAFVSLILIAISFALFFGVKFLMRRLKLPLRTFYPALEKDFSSKRWLYIRNLVCGLFILGIALIPATYPVAYGVSYVGTLFEKFALISSSVLLSFIVASVITVTNLVVSIPLALFIARSKGRIRSILDYLVEIPIVFPTVAVGISLNLFWLSFISRLFPFLVPSDLLLVIFAHIAITFSFSVRTIVNALETLDPSYEDAAKTLGATPFSTFSKVIYPQVRSSILAGSIFGFTRSLDETGATLAVAPKAVTAPIIIVNFVKKGLLGDAGVASLVLIIISYAILMLIRKVGGRNGKT